MNSIKYILILFLCISIASCKKGGADDKNGATESESVNAGDEKERTAKQSDGLTLLKGNFLYMADAAVLQTHREIYGVVIDEKMHELDVLAREFKKEDTDMVPVEIRGKISPKPENEEGWPYRVEIKEILSVSAPDPNSTDIIKIGQ